MDVGEVIRHRIRDPYEVSEIPIEELVPEVEREAGYERVVVVDNVPVIPLSKVDKLKFVLTKTFTQAGPLGEEGVYLPIDPETQKTRGFAFVEYKEAKDAEVAVATTDGLQLDKSHIFKVCHYKDFIKLDDVPDVYVPDPNVKEFKPKPNLRSWLLDERALEQYVIKHSDEIEFYWNEMDNKPVPFYRRKKWTEAYLTWSPQGSYLATLHKMGAALWAGPFPNEKNPDEAEFKNVSHFTHHGVKLIDFSPQENYIVTVSPDYQDHDDPSDPKCIIIWEIRSGKKLRGFPGAHTNQWPVFKWSYDDKYVAKMEKDTIFVYETPSMRLLNNKPLNVPGVRDFIWSPSDHIISWWVPEAANTPARVVLTEIPSKNELRQLPLFSVTDCHMHWHSRGQYLAVKVDRHTKTKKSIYTSFEILRVREKGVPLEVLKLDKKVQVLAFAWEPNGKRFAMIHTTATGTGSTVKPDVSFYSMEKKELKLLKTLEKKAANHLYWSPAGSYIVLAGLRNLNGALEFFNVDEMQTLNTDEHFMLTDVNWDPSGRYVCTSVSYWINQLENGYTLWNFQGRPIHRVLKDKLFQFLWRPRPPSLLSPEKLKEIKANLESYAKRYSAHDAALLAEKDRGTGEKKQEERKSYLEFMIKKRFSYLQMASRRRALRAGRESDDEEYEVIEEEVEELMEETRE